MSTYKGFNSVELRKPQRSKFDLSHERRSSTRMGRLTPIFITETLPNDTFSMKSEVMLRLAPLLAPIMHRVNVFVHHFFVPNRLLWKDWELFITNGRLGTETPPVPPYASIQTVLGRGGDFLDTGSIADHLGFDNLADAVSATYASRTLDLMPFAAWYKIWYDYYRDRNYVADNANLPLNSGNITSTGILDPLFEHRNRDWQHEYFTSALPWTQRGSEVLMPLIATGTVSYLAQSEVAGSITGSLDANGGFLEVGGLPGRVENIAGVTVDNSNVSINDLRRAVRLQEWLERNALAGSRYTESILAHFARRSSDARLQRAEYLGGGKVPVRISEVVTTAFSEDGAAEVVPAGNMAGHGIGMLENNGFKYNCEEHGFIVSVLTVMPTSAYMSGSERMFLHRNTFLDYPWPSFAHLGEQEVFKNELWTSATTIPVDRTEAPVFGYQSRYADWKYKRSSVHGDFRTSLDFWHVARKFASEPTLGATFCNFEDGLQDRVFAVEEGDTLWTYIFNSVNVFRSLPYFGTPQL